METNTEKIRITLDGRQCLVEAGLSILEAARQNGIHIPTLCHHPAVSAWGGCRLCMVEVDGAPRLAASCVTPVRDGMEVVTSNERIIESRRLILEFLFAERNHNCMFCAQSGDCELQDLAYELQMDHLSVFSSFDAFPVDITNQYMGLDHNRCILCGRCVRACAEITGARVLDFTNRGPGTLISFDLNETRQNSTCFNCGVCLEICPTGAIYNRLQTHRAVRGHSKKAWTKVDTICPICGFLCPTTATVCDNMLLKVESSSPGNVNRADRGQLCHRGRFDILKSRGERLLDPLVKDRAGNWVKTDWESAFGTVAERLNHVRDTHGGSSIFGLVSSMCANENLLLFKDLMVRGWGARYFDTFDGDGYRSVLKAREKTALKVKEPGVESIAQADFFLVIGSRAFEKHPIVPAMIHKRVLDQKAQVAVVGAGDFNLPQVHYRLAVQDDDLAATVKAMFKKALNLVEPAVRFFDPGGFRENHKDMNTAEILEQEGLDIKELETFDAVVRAFAEAADPLVLIGGGSAGVQNYPVLKDALRLAFTRNSGSDISPLMILKPYGNSAGAWSLGAACSTPVPAGAGWKAGLVMAADGETPGRAILELFESLEFLAVLSPFVPEAGWARKAEVVLPIPSWMEQDGTYTSIDGRLVVHKEKMLSAPANVMDIGEALIKLAQKAGLDLEYTALEDLRQQAELQIITK